MADTPLLFSAAPVFKVDGDVRGALARDLVHLETKSSSDGLDTFEATFLAIGPASGSRDEMQYLDGSVDFGKRIEVSLGQPGSERIVFSGKVSALELSLAGDDAPRVTVFAEDELMQLRMTTRRRTYEEVSDADIVRAVASAHGLDTEIDADGPTYDVVQQWNESDLAFLRSRARSVDADLWARDGKLHFVAADRRRATDVTARDPDDIVWLVARADLAHQRSSVSVSGYDADAREAIEEKAAGDVVRATVASGRIGADVLDRAFESRPLLRARGVPLTRGEATAFAKADMLRRSRRFAVVRALTHGLPDLTPGSHVTLEGVGEPFNGAGYRAVRVRHTFDLTVGHQTWFEAERATVNGQS